MQIMTPAELIRQIDNDPYATPRERALAEALDNATQTSYKQKVPNTKQLELQFAEVFKTTTGDYLKRSL